MTRPLTVTWQIVDFPETPYQPGPCWVVDHNDGPKAYASQATADYNGRLARHLGSVRLKRKMPATLDAVFVVRYWIDRPGP